MNRLKDKVALVFCAGSSGPGWSNGKAAAVANARARACVIAIDRVQFQRGLSMPKFMEQYGADVQCEAALTAARWPGGFACPKCSGPASSVPA